MAIISFYSSGSVEYIPDYMDNRNNPDPMIVTLRPMKASEYRRYITDAAGMTLSVSSNTAISFDNISPEALVTARNQALKQAVITIRNFKICDIKTESLIDVIDAQGLIDNAEDELLEDIMVACIDMSRLKEGVKKT